MRHINKLMLLSVLALPMAFASCSDDRDSNPTLDTSHVQDGFVLNVPANAANNTYDLVSASSLELTANQPNYGGVPYVTRYYVQVAIDGNFVTNPNETAYKELTSSYTTAKMEVSTEEMNDSIVQLFNDANPDAVYPSTPRPVYIRLRAVIDGINAGESYSNVITLPSVLATYVAPPATLADQLYISGSSIQEAWKSWKVVAPIHGLSGQYYTMAYFGAGDEFYWGISNGDKRGYTRLTSINDKANAGISAGEDDKVKVTNAGWYTLYFTGEIVDNVAKYTLNVIEAKAYIIGKITGPGNDGNGDWTEESASFKMTPSTDASGEWVSPAIPYAGELRAYIDLVPELGSNSWWRTEFTLLNGSLFFRNGQKINNTWGEDVGPNYSVTCAVGQKLYVNFDMNTGEVK